MQGKRKKAVAKDEYILAGPVRKIRRWHLRKKKKYTGK
jgi:hypothetical protein